MQMLSNIQRRVNTYPSETIWNIVEEETLTNTFWEAMILKPDDDLRE